MPPNNITPLTSAGSIISYPFKLVPTAVRVGATAANQPDLDCQCPCGLTDNNNITSSKLFGDLLTDAQKSAAAKALGTTGKTKKGVYVFKESYLFRSLLPSMRTGITSDTINDYGTKDSDPVLRIYGLDTPIITEDFLSGEDKDSLKTVKIWLSVCFPSGETATPTLFTSCADKTRNDNKTNVARADWRSLLPLVAFISYGLQYPKDLVLARTIDRSQSTATPPTPRMERRQVEAHVPLGEVDVSGKIVAQYVRTHLALQDICYNGTPAKYPYPLFSST